VPAGADAKSVLKSEDEVWTVLMTEFAGWKAMVAGKTWSVERGYNTGFLGPGSPEKNESIARATYDSLNKKWTALNASEGKTAIGGILPNFRCITSGSAGSFAHLNKGTLHDFLCERGSGKVLFNFHIFVK
jgi:hypothetical protein